MNQAAQQITDFLLRRKEVEKIAGISRSSIYRLIKADKFPVPVKLGTGAVRWKQSDVIAWLKALKKNSSAIPIKQTEGLNATQNLP